MRPMTASGPTRRLTAGSAACSPPRGTACAAVVKADAYGHGLEQALRGFAAMDAEKQRATVMISILGRSVPVEMKFDDLEKT